MKKLMKSFLTLVFCIGMLSSFAQSEWTLYKDVQGIKFYYKYVDCDFQDIPDAQWVLLKIENTTNKNFYVEWTQLNWYNGKCTFCSGDANGEARRQVKVNAKSSREGECISTCDKALRIFSKFIEFKTDDLLTKFELSEITLVEIKD